MSLFIQPSHNMFNASNNKSITNIKISNFIRCYRTKSYDDVSIMGTNNKYELSNADNIAYNSRISRNKPSCINLGFNMYVLVIA